MSVSDSERDKDWILAIGHALGLNSGFEIPIVPETEPFRRLFDAVKERELLALRARHRKAIAVIKELIVMAEGDAELFKQGGAWRPFYLAHADKLRAFLAAEQPAQEKVAP